MNLIVDSLGASLAAYGLVAFESLNPVLGGSGAGPLAGIPYLALAVVGGGIVVIDVKRE